MFYSLIRRLIISQNATLIVIYFRQEVVYSLYQNNNPTLVSNTQLGVNCNKKATIIKNNTSQDYYW